MVTPRQVYKQKSQLVVAIPPAFRKLLKVGAGATLYWHSYRDGEAVLTTRSTRKGGKPEAGPRTALLAAAEAEIDRLRARLEKQRGSIWNEYASQEYLRRMHIELKGLPVLDVINDRLRNIEQQLGTRAPYTAAGAGRPVAAPPRPRRALARSSAATSPAVASIDHYPSPEPSSSPSSQGEALAPGGAAPQANPETAESA